MGESEARKPGTQTTSLHGVSVPLLAHMPPSGRIASPLFEFSKENSTAAAVHFFKSPVKDGLGFARLALPDGQPFLRGQAHDAPDQGKFVLPPFGPRLVSAF